jgi:gliding motility-associated protein GldM
MSGGDLPPRQKMIGMMYLVLTALLAMNVSKSILDAFVNINTGIQSTGMTIDANNGFVYQQFDKARATGGANGKLWAEKSDKVKKMANAMFNHIEQLKAGLIAAVEGVPQEVADTLSLAAVQVKDNYDIPTMIMGIAEPPKSEPVAGKESMSGKKLREELNKYQKGLIGIFEDKEVKALITDKIKYLNTDEMPNIDGINEAWEIGLFYHVPLAAVITLLSKTQSDVRSAESEVISKLYERIDAGGVSFNAVQGMAVMPKAYILEGDTFRADIFTAAYDDRVDPEIYISTGEAGYDTTAALAVEKNGNFDASKIMKGTEGKAWGEGDWYKMTKEDIKSGKGNLLVKEGVGVHNWGGLIKLDTKKGPKVYPFTSTFEVGKPSLAVSADKMNVFYIGVDNPVSVSAPMPNFTASAPGLSKSGKGYMMRPRKRGKVNIVVTGIDETTGEKVNLGKVEFRVKRIPDPKSYFGGKAGSYSLKKIALKNASTVQAKMDNFDFDIRVKVSSFVFSSTKAGVVQEEKVNGNKLNSKCKSMVARAKRNQKFFIEKIKVSMPDGTTRQLAPIIITAI